MQRMHHEKRQRLGTDEKNRGLLAVADELTAQQELILEENKKDLEAAKEKGIKQSSDRQAGAFGKENR